MANAGRRVESRKLKNVNEIVTIEFNELTNYKECGSRR